MAKNHSFVRLILLINITWMYMKFTFLLMILGLSLKGWSQQNHFIYIQSDTKQAFYVKLDGSSSPVSSSASGYLILPKVPEGKFPFVVGFPDNSNPEQHFTCNITADKGFMLKKFPDKGWALYDLQELTLIYADKKDSSATGSGISVDSTASTAGAVPAPVLAASPVQAPTAPVPTQDSATGTAAVATTPATPAPTVPTPAPTVPTPAPSVPVVAAPTPAPTTTTATDTTPATPRPATDAFGDMLVAVTKDSTLKDIQAVNKPAPAVVKPAAKAAVKGKAGITLVSTALTDAGVEQVFLDKQANGKIDTVHVLIPEGNSVAQAGDGSTAAVSTPVGAVAPSAAPDDGTKATQLVDSNHAVAPVPAVPVAAPVTTATGTPIDTSPATPVSTAPVTPVPTATVTPVDTSHAFDPNSVVKKNKDTSGFVVPVFKKSDSATTNTNTTTSAAATDPGFGVQPAATTAGAGAAASTPDTGTGNPVASGNATASATGTLATGTSVTTTPARGTPGLVNTDCKHLATDDEFLKLRKKIAAESDLDKMIDIAKKGFKKSCFTTDQVKNLSFLFLQEDGRYKFIEEAYPYVSDSGNFAQLQSLFASTYYINRFKALIQH